MKTLIEPYLNLGGRCDEAVAFYQSKLGAVLEMRMTFGESPEAPPMPLPDGWADKVMHCSFLIGESRVMASDGCGAEPETIQGVSLSLTLPDESSARQAFTDLAENGEVFMPIGPTFWSPCFGMVQDAYGVRWMVTVPPTSVS
ncbi:PhnB protein [Haloferula luteola]|uniref:PhnB protein n=1 Tax=Haloferula luteola TaxID=595692 RepID=A0A840VGT5_9BACT|nr:VOC family protein [Haloferula luteola]MBB5353040.1 PhnB protein [Haloferula luteola]